MHSSIPLSSNKSNPYPDSGTISDKPKLYILKCQTKFTVQSLEIYLNPLDKKIYETIIHILQKHFSSTLIENWNITIQGNRIFVSSKDLLLGGGNRLGHFPGEIKLSPRYGKNAVYSKGKVEWEDGENKYYLKQNGSWFELSYSDPEQIPQIRTNLLNTVLVNFPFDSTFSYSAFDMNMVIRFCIPNSIRFGGTWIYDVLLFLQGASSASINDFQTMKIGKSISADPINIEEISIKNFLNLQSPPDDDLFNSLRTLLKVDELCLFHFFSKNIETEDLQVIRRQIKKSGILSSSRLNACPHLSKVKLGVLNDSDIKHNDHFYVHCFLGYPSINNHRRISNRVTSDLSHIAPLNIAFTACTGTIFLPYDQGSLHEDSFMFRGKKYTFSISEDDHIISYKRDDEILFTHHFTDEIFNNVDGLFLVLLKFIRQLDEDDKTILFSADGTFLKELFNAFFAFRAQVSFPEHLRYVEYSHPNLPKEKLQKLVNREMVNVPNLVVCRGQFMKLLRRITPEEPIVSPEIKKSLNNITNFFTRRYKDDTNSFKNYFAYLGGISAQLAIHFDPEICHEFTPEVLQAIIQIHLYSQTNTQKSEESEELYDLVLIKKLGDQEITIFSLIDHSVHDLDAVQMRMPPNSRFNTPQLNAEAAYLNQLTTFYQYGSILLRSIFILSTDDASASPSMIPFLQENHLKFMFKHGIEFLSKSQELESDDFSNLHGYDKDAFINEFHRGFDNFISESEFVIDDVIQTNIGDFAQSLVDGHNLLAPRFKHDLLDSKHFKAGILHGKAYTFLDGKFTFKDLIRSALSIMSNQQTLSVNGQLIADAMHVLIMDS